MSQSERDFPQSAKLTRVRGPNQSVCTRTYFVCLSAGDSPRNLITFFSETMWTGGSSLQKPFVSFWLTRSNIRKTSFFYAGITNAQASMIFTDSTMNVREDLASNFGRHSLTALIVYRSLLSLRKRYFVVMEVCLRTCSLWNRSEESLDPPMYRIQLQGDDIKHNNFLSTNYAHFVTSSIFSQRR